MGQNGMYVDFILLLTLRRSGKIVRRSAQVLGSSEKQTAQLLPTFLLRINELVENCAEEKNCAAGT